jgi:hypothetical protein
MEMASQGVKVKGETYAEDRIVAAEKRSRPSIFVSRLIGGIVGWFNPD